MNLVDIGVEDGLDRMIGGISEFGGKRKLRRSVSGVELGVYERMPQSNVAAGGEKNFAPDAGVFVGRSGIPVDPGEAEIIFFGREDFDGEGILAGFVQKFADTEFIGAIGAGDFAAVGKLLAVEPDVGAVIDAEEMEPDGSVGISGGCGKFSAEPVGAAERTVGRHVEIGGLNFVVGKSAGE